MRNIDNSIGLAQCLAYGGYLVDFNKDILPRGLMFSDSSLEENISVLKNKWGSFNSLIILLLFHLLHLLDSGINMLVWANSSPAC